MSSRSPCQYSPASCLPLTPPTPVTESPRLFRCRRSGLPEYRYGGLQEGRRWGGGDLKLKEEERKRREFVLLHFNSMLDSIFVSLLPFPSFSGFKELALLVPLLVVLCSSLHLTMCVE